MAHTKSVLLSVAAFGAVGWLVLVGGVGEMQRACGSAGYTNAGDAGYLGRVPCDVLFGYSWWVVFLQLISLSFCAAAVAGEDLANWKASAAGLLGVAAVLCMDTANTFMQFNHYADVAHKSAPRAAVAGAIMSSMANLVLLVAVGGQQQGVIIANMEMQKGPPPSHLSGGGLP